MTTTGPLTAPIAPLVVPRPRLVVFDVTDAEKTVHALHELIPGHSFIVRDHWTQPPNESTDVSIWIWQSDLEEFEASVGSLLRDLAFPLAATGSPYVVMLPFGADALQPRSLAIDDIALLDVEDFGTLLCEDGVAVSEPLLPTLRGRCPLTPIEEQLQKALHGVALDVKAQVRFDRYTLDFLVESDGLRLGVEADGHAYHEPDRDALRDAKLRDAGLADVLRFTGSEIHRDAADCAARVLSRITLASPNHRRRYHKDKLDESQSAAVSHERGAARVLAPAGAGKTRVLVNRIVKLVERGGDPDRILALAFNKKAADQLERRLHELAIPTSNELFGPQQGVHVATFNAFGHRFQNERTEPGSFRVVNDDRVWTQLMSSALSANGITLKRSKRGTDPMRGFLNSMERTRADLASPWSLEVEIERVGDNHVDVVPFQPIHDEFERRRIDRQIQTFSDQITTALRTLLDSPLERRHAQRWFQHVLVDEYQDLDAAQLGLVEVLSRPHRNLFVVGDDDQLIYSWRFARLTNILAFHERLPAEPHAKTYTLGTNYRSARAIVDSSRRLIDHNQTRVGKDITPRDDADAGSVRYYSSPDFDLRSTALLDFVASQRSRCGSWRRIAVLCRYRAQQVLVAHALDRAGIPRTHLLSYRLFADPQMRLVRDYIELVRQPQKATGELLASLLNKPNRYASNALVEEIRSAPAAWARLGDLSSRQPNDPFRSSALAEFRATVEALNHEFQRRRPTAPQLLEEVVNAFDLRRFWDDKQPSKMRKLDDADPTNLLFLIRILAQDKPDPTEFLAEWDAAAEAEVKEGNAQDDTLEREEDEETDRVVISTIHAAKGREYHSVCLWDYWSDITKLDEAELEEERRVFYVGMTRAEDSLLVTLDAERGIHPFVVESIAPQRSDELSVVRARRNDAAIEARDAALEVNALESELVRLHNGELLADSERALRELPARINELDAALRPFEDQLARLNRVRDLRGRRRAELTSKAHDLRVERQQAQTDLDESNQHVRYLRGDPTAHGRVIEVRIEDARRRLDDLMAEQERLDQRLIELELLASVGSRPKVP